MTTVKSINGEYPWGEGMLSGQLLIKSHFDWLKWETVFTREFVEMRDGESGMVLAAMEHYPSADDAYNAAMEALFIPAVVDTLGNIDFDEGDPEDDAMLSG